MPPCLGLSNVFSWWDSGYVSLSRMSWRWCCLLTASHQGHTIPLSHYWWCSLRSLDQYWWCSLLPPDLSGVCWRCPLILFFPFVISYLWGDPLRLNTCPVPYQTFTQWLRLLFITLAGISCSVFQDHHKAQEPWKGQGDCTRLMVARQCSEVNKSLGCGTALVVQWSGLCSSTARGADSIHGIKSCMQSDQKKKKL